VLIVFAGTGVAQVFGYRLGILSEVHTKADNSIALGILAALMGFSVAVTAVVGVLMALRLGGDRKTVWVCLTFGTLVSTALAVIAHLRQ
jgi:hypothetical protein